MDMDDHLINLENGIFDLQDSRLLKERGSRFLTKKAATQYYPEANCTLWEKFIREITDDDDEMIRQLQKAVGYTLSGKTDAQLFFVCTGNGANGKSVFLETIDYIMGTYSGKISASALTGAVTNKIPNELAGLTGKRFVTVRNAFSEIVNTTTLKELTGQDTLSARFLYKEFFQFKPKFKIWIATNHELQFSENSYALQRRMMNFDFTVYFTPDERDNDLSRKLQEELEYSIGPLRVMKCSKKRV